MPQQHPAEEGFGIKKEWLYFYCVQSCSFERFNYSRVDWLHEQIVRRVTSLYLIWFFIESGISTSCPIPHTHTHTQTQPLNYNNYLNVSAAVYNCTPYKCVCSAAPEAQQHGSTFGARPAPCNGGSGEDGSEGAQPGGITGLQAASHTGGTMHTRPVSAVHHNNTCSFKYLITSPRMID